MQEGHGAPDLAADGLGHVVGAGHAGDNAHIVARAHFAVRAHITHKFHIAYSFQSPRPRMLSKLWMCTYSPFLISLVAMPISSPYFMISSPLWRSEEHTSELQSRFDLVCRLLL